MLIICRRGKSFPADVGFRLRKWGCMFLLPYLALLVSVGLVCVDQLLKLAALEWLKPVHTVPLIEGVLHLTYVENRGASFGMMAGQQWLLVWVTALVLLALAVAIIAGKIRDRFALFNVAVILGGGVGNLIDRVYRGFVVDYVDFQLINFAVFNFADICITVGTAVLVCWIIFGQSQRKGKE